MRSQVERDAQTVTIATALGLLIAVMLVGVSLVWLLGSITDLASEDQAKLVAGTSAVAVAVSGRYLIRHRRDTVS